jgi:hypothetical protein
MASAIAAPHREEILSNGSPMSLFEERGLDQFAELLCAPKGRVSVHTHPLDDTLVLVAADYSRINVASAVASHLNNEPNFYRIPKTVDRTDLHYQPNKFAFVDDASFGHRLCMTVDDQQDSFIKKLSEHADDLRYVVLHPDILFLRPQLSFQRAKSHLNAGYRISVMSL